MCWAVKNLEVMVPVNQLQIGTNTIQIEGLASVNDKFRLVEYQLIYPHQFDFQGQCEVNFNMPQSTAPQYRRT